MLRRLVDRSDITSARSSLIRMNNERRSDQVAARQSEWSDPVEADASRTRDRL